MKLPKTDSRLCDRAGQTWAYMGRPYLFLHRGAGPQGSSSPWNDWIMLDLVTGGTLVTRLFRDTAMEDMPDRWERIA